MQIGLDYTVEDLTTINYIIYLLMQTQYLNNDLKKEKGHLVLLFAQKEGK